MKNKNRLKILISIMFALNFITLGLGAYAVDSRLISKIYIILPLLSFMVVTYIWGQVMKGKIKY